jgi:predicted acylesterase/phospholipase RssA
VSAPRSRLEVVSEAFPRVPVADLGRKLGLALSGGGFRASLYHIGVLARLADEDQLRRVEVLSCVSGGSIVGAYYYLELRRLLESTPDTEITRDDYVEVVRRVAKGFLKGVQRNIRTRVLASPTASLAVLFGDQTRTKYLGELIESELYANVEDGHPEGEPRYISALAIRPFEAPEDFHPRRHNWLRQAKVPVLILNATTLNTGHLWQFTATWMGEPPEPINPLVDLRERLRRLYYSEAPPEFQRIRLGHAVAASAGVPGLFEPFELDGLYPNRKVRLVDGGVFDNQGVEGLLAEDCRDLMVSDASGPLCAEADVAAGRIGVPVRSNSIGMSLVRDRQYQSLWMLKETGSVSRVIWVHLAQGVAGGATVDWIGCDPPTSTHRDHTPPRALIDERIAAMRTDLDSFSEAEAYVLMTSGYRMIERALRGARMADAAPLETSWPFFAVEPIMNRQRGYERAHERLLQLLRASSQTLFKLRWIVPSLTPVSLAVAVAALYWAFRSPGSLPPIPVRTLAVAGASVAATAFLLSQMRRVVRTQVSLSGLVITLLALVAWIPARLHLRLLDPLFLKLGEVGRLRTDAVPPHSSRQS